MTPLPSSLLSPPSPSLHFHWPLATILSPAPHAPRAAVRQTSGVRSCVDPSPLATAGEPTAEFPMNSRVSFCIFVHFCLPPPVHGASGSQAPAQRLPRTERDPISTSGPSLSFFTEPGDSCGQIIRSPPLASAQPLTILACPEALDATRSRRACRMAINRNARPFLLFMVG
jgi:hypothetical protein